MNPKIEKTFTLYSAVHFQDKFLINLYDFSVSMEVETDSVKEQNIAMDRIKYFLYDCLENAVFVYEKEHKAIEKYMNSGINVCTLPDEPYDQIIASVLLLKFKAITEGRLIITDIQLTSKLSDNVRFWLEMEVVEEAYGSSGWWMEPNTLINTNTKTNKKDKIVKLFKNTEWNEVGLSWKPKASQTSEIVFTMET